MAAQRMCGRDQNSLPVWLESPYGAPDTRTNLLPLSQLSSFAPRHYKPRHSREYIVASETLRSESPHRAFVAVAQMKAGSNSQDHLMLGIVGGMDTKRCVVRTRDGRLLEPDSLPQGDSFARSDTFLHIGAPPERKAAELQSLLGNSSYRLRSGATLPEVDRTKVVDGTEETMVDPISLEQAKSRARVEIDILLESDACTQGGELRGQILLLLRKRSKKEAAIQLAQPKVRVVGFESISSAKGRYVFYQCAAPLSDISSGFKNLYAEGAGAAEEFVEARAGRHVAQFAMQLPVDSAYGAAKGVPTPQPGIAVRYIAIFSVKVRCAATGKRSVAHFYRDCEIWPRLDPTIVLAPAARPLQATTSKSITMLGTSRVKLTALLHRLTFIAGQRCYVAVAVLNETKKMIKLLTLTLVRTTTAFKPRPGLAAGRSTAVDPDACETATTHKVVAETVLERSDAASKRHASGKGWWAGVGPGQEIEFSHYVLIPPDAASITRGRLLEVEYTLRVTLSAGSLTSNISVTLPIRVINFLSIDSRPQQTRATVAYTRTAPRRHSIDGELDNQGNLPAQQWQQALSQAANIGETNETSRHVRMPCDAETLTDSAIFSEAPGHAMPSGDNYLRVANPDSPSYATRPSVGEEAISSLIPCDIGSGFPATSSTWSDHPESDTASGFHRCYSLGDTGLDDSPDSDEEVDFLVSRAPTRAALGTTYFSEAEPYGSRGPWAGVHRPAGPRDEDPSSEREEQVRSWIRMTKPRPSSTARNGEIEAQYETPFALRVREKLAAAASPPAGGRIATLIADQEAPARITQEGSYISDPSATQSCVVTPHGTLGSGRGRGLSRQLPKPPALVSDASNSSTEEYTPSDDERGSYSAQRLSHKATGYSEANSRAPSSLTVPSVYSCATQAAVTPWCHPLSEYDSTLDPLPSPVPSRPSTGLGLTGGSSTSVKGRVAYLEGRIQTAQDAGSAYV